MSSLFNPSQMKTLTRYIPQGFEPISESPLAAFYGSPDGTMAIAYIGKRSNHEWFYKFKDKEQRNKRIQETIDRLNSWEEWKLARKVRRLNQFDDVEIGDILYDSWGYEQTNIDFYQVVAKTKGTITIREIAGYLTDESTGNSMAGYKRAKKGAFVGEPIVKRSFGTKCGYLNKTTEDKSHYCSWYA